MVVPFSYGARYGRVAQSLFLFVFVLKEIDPLAGRATFRVKVLECSP